MKKILLVDDKRIFHRVWMRGITTQFTFLHAYSMPQARQLFAEHADVAAVVMDACMDGIYNISRYRPIRRWLLSTEELIADFRQQFSGPIIAAPSQPWHFKPMLEAGCSHYVWKGGVARLVSQLLVEK